MIIKGVKLHNIRSYLDESIEFPQGSTLLAGDIGSGKTSILLAIEFALFGIARGVVSGTSLLRTDKTKGYVELHFTIQNKDVIIKRFLKRQKQDVRQDHGYIIIDGVKREATPVELKSIILDLLGYPSQLLTKSKSLIYRYTVYTPQEEMKQILLEKSEYRVDTLRKLFQIDKYRRIRENTQITLRSIKQKKSVLQGAIQDLHEKQLLLNQTKQEIKQTKQALDQTESELKKAESELKNKQQLLNKIEKQAQQLLQLKNNLQIQETKLEQNVSSIQRNRRAFEQLEEEINKLLEKSQKIKIVETAKDESQTKLELEKTQQQHDKTLKKQAEQENNIKHQELLIQQEKKVVENISKLKKCPVCKQDVTPQHTKHIKETQDAKIQTAKQSIQKSQSQLILIKEVLLETNNKLQALREQQNKLVKSKIDAKEKQNLQNLVQEKQKRKDLLEQETKKLKQDVGKINTQKLKTQKQIESYKNLEQDYERLRKEQETTLAEEKQLTVAVTKTKTELSSKQQTFTMIEQEIQKKLEAKKRLQKLKQIQNWLQTLFINLMTVMEHHVMMRVYNEFNEIFQQFFEMLVEIEVMTIRLDDEFSPIIEQNGYEVDYEYLSGGEKTSIALAYRLALNKVINDLIENIKTKDLIILDEPTDGFSTQQLDKIRDVLDALNTKQTIIVSHESKIESFVENVIRITKNEHISSVASG